MLVYIIFLPLHVSTDTAFHTPLPEGALIIYTIFEVIWYANMILSFCKVPRKMKHPSLWNTSKLYVLQGSFVIDFASSVVCDSFLFFGGLKSLWFYRIKSICILKAGDIKSAYMFVLNNYVNFTSQTTKNMYQTLADVLLYSLITV